RATSPTGGTTEHARPWRPGVRLPRVGGMDRTIVITASAPLAVGHLVEIVERVDADGAERTVVSITDRETGVHYQREGVTEPGGEPFVWHGRVLSTTVSATVDGPRTTVRVDPVRTPAVEAELALRGADAAVEAAKIEADRWGGSDKP